MVIFIAILLVGPVVVFVSMATRIDAARRQRRFAALRLAGATRWQTGVIAIAETAGATIVGAGFAVMGFAILLPILQAQVRIDGLRFPSEDLLAPAWQVAVVVSAVPLVAVATALVTVHRAQLSPLEARRPVMRRSPTAWYLAPLLGGYILAPILSLTADSPIASVLVILAAVSQLVGIYTTGVYLSMWVGRGLARISSSAPAMIAARRIAADPYATFRAVGGIAIAASIATGFATIAAGERASVHTSPTVLDDGVVMVLARGATEDALAPLLSRPGVVVARHGAGDTIAIPCADLASVTRLTCPLPATEATATDLQELAIPPFHRDPADPGLPVGPFSITEPSWNVNAPILALFVPTDGTTADVERVRTIAIQTAPYGLSRTADDWTAARFAGSATGFATFFQYAMLFVILVAACSLTVSVIATLVERRRPFALLRASGMPLRQLRHMAFLETALPLVVTAVASVGIPLASLAVVNLVYSLASLDSPPLFAWPSGSFFASAGIGLAVAVATSLLSWPIMDEVTRHDSVRYE
jgi:hypothetical protein